VETTASFSSDGEGDNSVGSSVQRAKNPFGSSLTTGWGEAEFWNLQETRRKSLGCVTNFGLGLCTRLRIRSLRSKIRFHVGADYSAVDGEIAATFEVPCAVRGNYHDLDERALTKEQERNV